MLTRNFMWALYLFSVFCTKSLASNVILLSIPKCGTHLAMKCICEILDIQYNPRDARRNPTKSWVNLCGRDARKPLLACHALFTPENANIVSKNFKGIFILRDPRDQCVSFVNYASEHKVVWPVLGTMSFDKALGSWIQDTSLMYTNKEKGNDPVIRSFRSIDDFYRRYIGWMNHPDIYTTTFEKLVGCDGGGDRAVQLQEILNIAAHLNHPISKNRAAEIADGLFGGGSMTFRKGQIGSWKLIFSQEHRRLFKRAAGQLLIDLNYEQDLHW